MHIVAEFYDADAGALADPDGVVAAMEKATKAAGATALSSHKHYFSPHGVSCVVIIQESNLCIHTWPEHGYAAADFFTCGTDCNTWKAFAVLKEYFKTERVETMELKRGNTKLISDPSILSKTLALPKSAK